MKYLPACQRCHAELVAYTEHLVAEPPVFGTEDDEHAAPCLVGKKVEYVTCAGCGKTAQGYPLGVLVVQYKARHNTTRRN